MAAAAPTTKGADMTAAGMERDVSRMTVLVGDPPHRELAVGALVCRRKQAATLRKLLPRAWCGTEITGYSPEGGDDSEQLAVHLSSEGAAALHAYGQSGELQPALATHAMPDSLREMLDRGECAFHRGLRRGSVACRGAAGKNYHLSTREKRTSLVNKAHCMSREQHRGEAAAAEAATPRPPLFRFCELFAGIGGFRLGLEPLGGECCFTSELEPEARQVYVANFGGEPPAGNIMDIGSEDIPHFDLLTAGFPCQSWSETGEVGGFADPRGVLFYEITRLLYAKKPAGFLLENVPNLAKVGDGAALELILSELRAAGYSTHHRIVNCRPLVPQRRLRLYLVGFLDANAAAKFKWPAWVADGDTDASEREAAPGMPRPTEFARGWRTVSDILEPMPVAAIVPPTNSSDACPASSRAGQRRWQSYVLSQQQWTNVCDAEARNVQRPNSIWRRLVNPCSAARTLIGTYRTGFMRHSQFVAIDADVRSADGGEAASEGLCETREKMLRRLPENDENTGVSQGSTAPAPRFFTQRECCRLMGFPEWYETTSAFSENEATSSFTVPDGEESMRFYHMIGNAVVPPVIEEIAKEMLLAGLLPSASQ
eukprot:Tamp_09189.p1 GENE.Tamp_09189~~Tamp_09189.p1  ORF type:complete len:633 (-),score=98.66 Tamp_09189:315-2111(-)